MCSAIITRNIFIVNAEHTVLQDLLLPPGQPKLSVSTTGTSNIHASNLHEHKKNLHEHK